MQTVLLVYVITQLITTAYGLAVIESARPFVEKKLIDEGYQKNKNSMYRFSYTLSNIAKGFIPFYYLIKAIKIVRSKGDISRQVQEQINSKNYVSIEEELKEEVPEVQEIEENKTDDLVNSMNLVFEKPEKYTARRNDITLFDTYETPIEYEEKLATKEEKLELTPYISDDKVEVVKQVVVKNEVTSKDIAKAITDLDVEELLQLKEKLSLLANIKKKEKGLKLEKDVA